MVEAAPAPAPRARIVCAACGSDRLRRSRPKTFGELFLRTFLRARFHVCKQCRARGWHLGKRGISARRPLPPGAPPRPSSSRRRRLAYRLPARLTVYSLLVAGLLGLGIGYWVWQSGSQRVDPSPGWVPPP